MFLSKFFSSKMGSFIRASQPTDSENSVVDLEPPKKTVSLIDSSPTEDKAKEVSAVAVVAPVKVDNVQCVVETKPEELHVVPEKTATKVQNEKMSLELDKSEETFRAEVEASITAARKEALSREHSKPNSFPKHKKEHKPASNHQHKKDKKFFHQPEARATVARRNHSKFQFNGSKAANHPTHASASHKTRSLGRHS